MVIRRNEEKIKAGLIISTKVSSDAPLFESQKVKAEILDEPKKIKEMQKKLMTLMEYEL